MRGFSHRKHTTEDIMRHLAGDVRLFKILCTRCERTPVLHLTATRQTSHGVEWVGSCPCGAHATVTTDGELAEWPTEEDLDAAEYVATMGFDRRTLPAIPDGGFSGDLMDAIIVERSAFADTALLPYVPSVV